MVSFWKFNLVPGEKRNCLLSLIDLKWSFLVIAFPLCKTKKEATKTDFFCLSLLKMVMTVNMTSNFGVIDSRFMYVLAKYSFFKCLIAILFFAQNYHYYIITENTSNTLNIATHFFCFNNCF